eukprot:6294962-Pyramimonas_sp.AAC.1
MRGRSISLEPVFGNSESVIATISLIPSMGKKTNGPDGLLDSARTPAGTAAGRIPCVEPGFGVA